MTYHNEMWQKAVANDTKLTKYDVEGRIMQRGHDRAMSAIRKAIARGNAAETPAGTAIVRRAIAPLSEAIKTFFAEARAGGAGRRHSAVALIGDLDPDMLAYITLRAALSAAHDNASLTAAASAVATRIQAEILADQFEDVSPALMQAIINNCRDRSVQDSRIPRSLSAAVRHFNLPITTWSRNQQHHVGTKLVELLIGTLGLIEAHNVPNGRRQRIIRLRLTDAIGDWLTEFNVKSTFLRPDFMPLPEPCVPWTGLYGGGHTSVALKSLPVVSRMTPAHEAALADAPMTEVYTALNAVQDTPWQINQRVLDVAKAVWDRGWEVGDMPSQNPVPIPVMPDDLRARQSRDPERKAFVRKMRDAHVINATSLSRKMAVMTKLSMADELSGWPAMYYPHHCDFRGRIYALCQTLSPQGDDLSKGLLRFAEGKPLGERGVFWLGVHGANLFGNDKVSLDDRYSWACRHASDAARCAQDPLTHRWWTEADKPFQFLAWCFEWNGVNEYTQLYNAADDYVSHLPVALDGSCNGLQHFAAMLRDPVTGKAVNLVPNSLPNDIYQTVADRVKEELTVRVQAGGADAWVYASWLQFGIDRKTTKRSVMVLPYGGTYQACAKYVREAVNDRLALGEANPFGDHLQKAVYKLASIVWQAMGDVITSGRETMAYIQNLSRIMSAANLPMAWTAPTGMRVMQTRYYETKHRRVKTRFSGSILMSALPEAGQRIDSRRQATASAPNFVHSMDAAALVLTTVAAKEAGIHHFAMIHDSYGTHACNTGRFATILREQFVEMYHEHDVVAELAASVQALVPDAKIPDLPKKGTLNLEDVIKSQYFFA